MAKLKLSLGLIPSTSKIEQEENTLIGEFEKLKKFSESDELKCFNEPDARANLTDFKTKKEHIDNLRFKDSEEKKRSWSLGNWKRTAAWRSISEPVTVWTLRNSGNWKIQIRLGVSKSSVILSALLPLRISRK